MVQHRGGVETFQTLDKLRISQGHCFLKVLFSNGLCNCTSLSYHELIKKKLEIKYLKLTIATASINGTRITLFSLRPIIYDGVFRVASKSALTASTPCNVGYRRIRRSLNEFSNSYQNTIVVTWSSTSLGMPQCGDPGVQTQFIG